MAEGSQIADGHDMNGVKTRPSLLLRVRNLRDQKSWDEFVELYSPLVLRYLRRIGVPNQDALDLLQDVLGIVVRHIGSFEYDPGKSFRAWLRTIARHPDLPPLCNSGPPAGHAGRVSSCRCYS